MAFHKSILHLSVSSLLFLPQGGDTLLHWASGGGHSNTVKMLLELDINSTNHAKCFFFTFFLLLLLFILFVINKTDVSMMIATYAYFIRRYTRYHDFLSRSEADCQRVRVWYFLFRKEAQTYGEWFQKAFLITQHKWQSLIWTYITPCC